MTIILIMLIIIAKPDLPFDSAQDKLRLPDLRSLGEVGGEVDPQQDGPTSLPMKSFNEIAQDNPYMTGVIKSQKEIDDEWAAYKS